MLNAAYQLTSPRKIEMQIRDEAITGASVLVRPKYLSICNADQRYYQGTRSAEILAKKLPMALIHECVGEVVLDNTRTFESGNMVAMVPNIPRSHDSVISENYLRSSLFRASSTDGFMQETVVTTPDRCVQIPENVNLVVASFTELCSVVLHSIERFVSFSHNRKDTIGIWGDGNVGYIAALFLKKLIPDSRIVVFGRNEYKLADFTFADRTCLVSSIPSDLIVDHAFECAGGMGCETAIDQIIDHIAPEGTISLLGVSENPVPINTRMILEKGLRLFGSSRSGRADFESTLALYHDNPVIPQYLEKIVGQVIDVNSIADMDASFEADMQKKYGKTIMRWNA